MSASLDYLNRVCWHRDHCVWHPVTSLDRRHLPQVGRRVCFEVESTGNLFFGVAKDFSVEMPEWGDEYAYESISRWCYETEDHPGIPVVRCY